MDVIQPHPHKTSKSLSVFPELKDWLRKSNSLEIYEKEKLIELITSRHNFGVGKYETGLKTYNGRDPDLDAKQELGDCLQYLYQCKMEGKDISKENIMLLKVIGELVTSFSNIHS